MEGAPNQESPWYLILAAVCLWAIAFGLLGLYLLWQFRLTDGAGRGYLSSTMANLPNSLRCQVDELTFTLSYPQGWSIPQDLFPGSPGLENPLCQDNQRSFRPVTGWGDKTVVLRNQEETAKVYFSLTSLPSIGVVNYAFDDPRRAKFRSTNFAGYRWVRVDHPKIKTASPDGLPPLSEFRTVVGDKQITIFVWAERETAEITAVVNSLRLSQEKD